MISKKDSGSEAESTKIMFRLKTDTKEYHSKLESLPFFNSLITHKLPLECYVNQLRSLSIVHGVLENEIATSDDPLISAIWNDDLRKLPLLEADLSFFKPRVVSDAASAIEAALDMAAKIRLRKMEKPITLMGYLYVFEGSTLGNNMHRPDISATFYLNELDGCHYYSSYHNHVQDHWKQFSEIVNNTLDDPSLHDSVIEAAHEAFNGLEKLYTALYPLEKSRKSFHVTRINPEAGNHPIPDDEREIQAALKASDRGWGEFAYYQQRYGDRGKRFSDSDTCWLVTLTALDPKTLQQQVDWLCRVLSTRGMPTIMMEQTLRYLHEELLHQVPEKSRTYEKLRGSADILKKTRENRIQDTTLHALGAEFEQAVGPEMASRYQNTGTLLAAAVADEKNGIIGSVNALQGWLTDLDRFSDTWIQAVNSTIDKANHFNMCG